MTVRSPPSSPPARWPSPISLSTSRMACCPSKTAANSPWCNASASSCWSSSVAARTHWMRCAEKA